MIQNINDEDRKVDQVILKLIKEVNVIAHDRTTSGGEFFDFCMNFIETFCVNYIGNVLLALQYPKDQSNEIVEKIMNDLFLSMEKKLKETLHMFDKNKVH